MAYQALYRKWRPASFDDVRGQDHIVTTLKNQLAMNRIGHAYLFCGTRGTGKTSVAKIFARAVNCEHPTEAGPCNECEMCRAVNEQRSMNVIEIDAASNNGVDNIRQIREEVAFSPPRGRYKVYIIDEVHMLSTGAFNALLKTLEEPPSYVIFILATTEPQRIPVTILYRCQRYDFHRITPQVIAGRLKELSDAEGIDAQEEALGYIARAADGSMRDALSLLDQCVSFYIGQTLTYENVLDVLGAVDTSVFGRLVRKLCEGDAGGTLGIIGEAIAQGRDVMQFVQDLTMYFRNLMMVKCGDSSLAAAYVSRQQLEALEEEAQLVSLDTLMRYIRIFSELSGSMRYSSQKRILLEMAAVKLCRPAMEEDRESLVQRMEQLEKRFSALKTAVENGAAAAVTAGPGTGARAGGVSRKKEKPAAPKMADTQEVARLISEWEALENGLPAPLRINLRSIKLTPGEGNEVIMSCRPDFSYTYWSKSENLEQLRKAAQDYIGAQVGIRVHLEEPEMEETSDDDFFAGLNLDGIDVEE